MNTAPQHGAHCALRSVHGALQQGAQCALCTAQGLLDAGGGSMGGVGKQDLQ